MTSYDSLKETKETNERIDKQMERNFGTKDPKRDAREKDAEALRQKMLAKVGRGKTNAMDKGR